MNMVSILCRAIVAAVLVCAAFVPARADVPEIIIDPTARWSAQSGEMRVELRGDFLPDYGLEILVGGSSLARRASQLYPIRDSGSLTLYAPYGHFQGFIDGTLDVRTDVVLRHAGNQVSLEQLVIMPVTRNNHPALEVRDRQGRLLLTLTHLHIDADHDNRLLTIHNADVNATPMLSSLLELPVLAGAPLGMAWLDLKLQVPAGADLTGDGGDLDGSGLSCDGRPFWPQEGTGIDVTLIGIGTVAYQGRDTSDPENVRIKAAPSATLKNESEGDVPWIEKFTSLDNYPYMPPDQHPFLVWNMYRISDGRIEQLSASGVKHAFNTINVNCSLSCGYIDGSTLAPGCEDVYSSGTNNNNSNQGPRYDIVPSVGLFDSCNSFFSPGAGCSQTKSSTDFENRLMVPESELSTPGARYFLDAWYVIQFDTEIWNSMGYHEIDPSPSGDGWSFNLLGSFTEGPVISEWVTEVSPDPMADHVIIQVPNEDPQQPYPDNMPQGHLRVLVQVTEVSETRWRYNYAVQNYDFDRNLDRFDIPLPDGAQIFDTYFGDVEIDGEDGDPWTVVHSSGVLSFQAPSNNHLSWFGLYNFELETNVEPTEAGQVTLGVAEAGNPNFLTVDILSPGAAELNFEDGFE